MLLKFDKSGRVEETRVEDSGYVKPVFNDFIKDFGDSQTNKENIHFVELKYKVVVKIIEKDPDTGEPIGDPITQTTEGFIQAETIHGGDMGLRLRIHKLQNGTSNSSASRQLSVYRNKYLCFEKKSKRTRNI